MGRKKGIHKMSRNQKARKARKQERGEALSDRAERKHTVRSRKKERRLTAKELW